jgi:hypothetical protein
VKVEKAATQAVGVAAARVEQATTAVESSMAEPKPAPAVVPAQAA